MCEYCEKSKSLFYDRHSKDVREVVVELDGSLSISSNHYDFDEEEKRESIGFSIDEAIKMSQFSYNIEIKYCPMCGKKLNAERRTYGKEIIRGIKTLPRWRWLRKMRLL